MDQAMIGRWIARLDQYHFKTVHRPRTQHRNVDGLSKRTNDYIHCEQILGKLPEVSEGFNFMSQKDHDDLPTVPYFDKHVRIIPDHPDLPPEARTRLPLLYILKKKRRNKTPEEPPGDTPWYPQIQWKTTPSLEENQKPNCILSITTRMPPARIDITDPTLSELPVECQMQAATLRTIGTTSVPFVERVNNITVVDLSDTSTEISFFAQNLLSSTEMSEEGLTENEKRARTDPQLLKPIPGPDLSSILSFWREGARDQLAKVRNEYDNLFMKHKADIGKCTIAKHCIELEPKAISHREGSRRMSPDKAAKSNQEVRNLLGLIQPSGSHRVNPTLLLTMGEWNSHGEEKDR